MASEEQVTDALDELDDRELQMFIASRLVSIEKELRSMAALHVGVVVVLVVAFVVLFLIGLPVR